MERFTTSDLRILSCKYVVYSSNVLELGVWEEPVDDLYIALHEVRVRHEPSRDRASDGWQSVCRIQDKRRVSVGPSHQPAHMYRAVLMQQLTD